MFVFGASVLGEIVFDVATDLGLEVEGFVDDVTAEQEFCGVPVVGGLAWLLALAATREGVTAFVAVGGNEGRAGVARRLRDAGVALPSLVHPRAWVSRRAALGAGNLVLANSYVGTGVTMGDGNLLFPGVCLTHHNRVGDFCFFAPNVSVGGRTVMADRCKFGMNSVLPPDLTIDAGFACPPGTVVGE